MNEIIPIVIPSYEPDDRLIQLLEDLRAAGLGPVILVNDGSSEAYNHFFEMANTVYRAVVLTHEVNKGKGRALKTAFSYCLENYKNLIGCITADSDGQHTTKAISDIKEQLLASQDMLVIGVRNFNGVGIPVKSQFGNNLTRKVFRALYKKDISDTQTGLRGIPFKFMKMLLEVPGERFEYETRMLIKAVEEGVGIQEIPIETIYDSKDNHVTHFRPIVDSIRIYTVFGYTLGKFMISSLSSSVIDLVIFQIACFLLKHSSMGIQYIVFSTVIARIISAIYNYVMNYFFVFRSNENKAKSLSKYAVLAVLQMMCSAVLTTGLIVLTQTDIELLVKIPIDVMLFLVSYYVQKRLIF